MKKKTKNKKQQQQKKTNKQQQQKNNYLTVNLAQFCLSKQMVLCSLPHGLRECLANHFR